MAISNITSSASAPSVGSISSARAVSTTDNAKAGAEKFAATIVTLSAKAIKLNQSESASAQTKTAQTSNSARVDASAALQNQTSAKASAEAASGQAKETEPNRSRLINTYA